MSCLVLIRTSTGARSAAGPATAGPAGLAAPPANDGYGPVQLQSAYSLPSATAGSGQTVAIVDAYDDPAAAADLAAYRLAWGLPACGAGCFTKVNQHGAASPLPAAAGHTGWATEVSLDLDMVSAICPKCRILLVEAGSASEASLFAAENTAVRLGAAFISNSWGGTESHSDSSYDTQYFNHPGIVITAAAGDSGYGVIYPAASRYVTAVGGTTLTTAAGTRGWAESAWGSSAGGAGTGSGCSADDSKPSWQHDPGCARRTANDVAADANPNTGVAIYDSYDHAGWLEVGGTSVGAPLIASAYALAGKPAAGTYPAQYPYQHPASLYDVTSGADGSCGGSYLCTAQSGYDGPTGLGTPDGVAAFRPSGNTVTVTSPGAQASTTGKAVRLQLSGSDSAPGQVLAYSATGLPAGLAISHGGVIAGTPTAAADYSVVVAATDSSGAIGSAAFTWTVSAPVTGCPAQQLLGNPGFETGKPAPWATSANVVQRGVAGTPAHSGKWLAWLGGYVSKHTDTLSQTVTIPSGCTSAQLSFWLDVISNDPAGHAYDTSTVQVIATGSSPVTLATYSNLNVSPGYIHHAFPLSGYGGKTITVKLTGVQTLGGTHITSFLVDDIAVTVS